MAAVAIAAEGRNHSGHFPVYWGPLAEEGAADTRPQVEEGVLDCRLVFVGSGVPYGAVEAGELSLGQESTPQTHAAWSPPFEGLFWMSTPPIARQPQQY